MRQQEHFGGNGREKGERRNKKMKSRMFWRKWLGKRGKKEKKRKRKKRRVHLWSSKKEGKKKKEIQMEKKKVKK